jgi:hypothetical protein
MSSPKKDDYKASETEKTSASIALADKTYFNEKYTPLLKGLAEEASTTDYSNQTRGIAQADTMQALTGDGPVFQYATGVDNAADLASAAVGNMLQASQQGLAISKDRQLNTLATARGQANDAASGLAQASRATASKELQFAKAKQSQRLAAIDSATAFAKQAGQNKSKNDALAATPGLEDEAATGLKSWFT